MDLSRLRNLSIVAHIDHGKSTLADRILELTGAVDPRDMRAQYLDSMDIERERGITIKAQYVRVDWKDHIIHLIDTPGHVDFGYEVSPVPGRLRGRDPARRRGPGHRGPDAGQLLPGHRERPRDRRRASTRSTCRPPIPTATPPRSRPSSASRPTEILRISAKTGEGVPELLDAVIERIPAPTGDPDAPLQALIFDSYYDQYRGVVSRGAGHGRHAHDRRPAALHAGRRHPRRRRDRRPHPEPHAGRRARPGGGRLPHRRHQGRGRGPSRRDRHRAARPATDRPRGLPRPQAHGVLRPLSRRRRRVRRPARRPREAAAERRQLHLPAGDLRRPRASASAAASSACCTWRSCGSGWSGSSTCPHRHRPVRGVPGALDQRRGASRSTTPREMPPPPQIEFIEEPYLTSRCSRPSDYTGTVMDLCQTRRGEMLQAGVPLARAARAGLPHPARRGRHRLLRPAEEPDQGLRQPRLRGRRLRALRPGQGRRAAERRARRRLLSRSSTGPRPTSTAGA